MNIRTWLVMTALLAPASVFAANNCTFSTVKSTMILQGNCTTDAPLLIPQGMMMDLGGFAITAVDPGGDHFRGGVVQNAGSIASISNGTIQASGLANVCDGGVDRLRGVLFDGASGSITDLQVLNINQNPAPGVLSGCQEGNAIEVRNFFGASPTTVHVVIESNSITGYQKTGIVCNGDADCTVFNNTVIGAGPQIYIAQNGIQIGFGATGQYKFNTVNGNAYSGSGNAVSGGFLLVAGPFYDSPYSVGTQIQNNSLDTNDVGVYLSQLDATGNPPATQTSVKVIGNTITNPALTNIYPYQAGVSDQGNNDKIINNAISGAGYDPATLPGATFEVDADVSFTNRPKVHSNK